MNFSDISIVKLLPPNLANDKNVCMMCEAFDAELRRIIADIPGVSIIPNLVLKEITDNMLLDLLAWQFHCDFYSADLSIETKQEIILKSLDWHTRKGTPAVIEEVVSTVFSKAKIEEWYEYGGNPYRFRIATDEEIPDTEILNNLIRIINSVKNTRSYLDKITEMNNFYDDIVISESIRLIVRRNDIEHFTRAIKYNGTVKYDGHTINENVYAKGKYNGYFKYSGNLKYSAYGKIVTQYYPTRPFKYSGGIIDDLIVSQCDRNEENLKAGDSFTAGVMTHHKFDGTFKYNGAVKYNAGILFPLT